MVTKTPTYTRKAIKNYDKKVIKKQIVLNPDIDSDLLEAINQDDMAFSKRVKELLRDFYQSNPFKSS